ncbi:hypothetical protein TBLA_0B05900 [Henningerozyma blattae CBS 6284]|uniref:RING-Gid-type domain-containing protein n=1 Tax=Henningerozyma blattae (strain ATCC 34711 / CBS 6284 / DSM 70876 / NBRC 10599 / NRRL Y-10934 / UCD 77-7) TaxID=1071380 RepID=I2GZ64_HENB6|nr:hypothetical protein TBLA_0B05900 [Tetrapisispora blattae CBS 6284]CCH59416.1 hypothetical protein TBLA_0B05900 [Tetrapisispora blattae CBS 6284]
MINSKDILLHKEPNTLLNEPSVDFHLILNQQLFNIPFNLLLKNESILYNTLESHQLQIKSISQEISKLLQKKEKLPSTFDKQVEITAVDKITLLINTVDSIEKSIKSIYNHDLQLILTLKKRYEFFNNLKLAKETRKQNALIDWYQNLTNLLITDYLIRNSNGTPTSNKGIKFFNQLHNDPNNIISTHLLDSDILITSNQISNSLLINHDLSLLINWIETNSHPPLSKSFKNLIFQSRFQQFIELIKQNDISNAIHCYQIHLINFIDDPTHFNNVKAASGLLIFYPFLKSSLSSSNDSAITSTTYFDRIFHKNLKSKSLSSSSSSSSSTISNFHNFKLNNNDLSIYKHLLHDNRWLQLNDFFLSEYYSIYGISVNDPLLIYLSLGISSLKTKECLIHGSTSTSTTPSQVQSYINDNVLNNKCPVCNNDFKSIASQLPFAHHDNSILFDNPIMLPNGNIFDSNKLTQLTSQLKRQNIYHLNDDQVLDPIELKVFNKDQFVTMYPT